ncbi:MAG: non-homologous end-joining DNA ligase [Gemmatimonadetes bacterium]|nr:non-homologous end-joining DNA ligase [Gemmatimonadota bacterium]
MTASVHDLPEEARDALREASVPEWTSPMLATLTDESFSDPEWIYERKLDGVRLLAFREGGGEVRLWTRNRKSRDSAYPEIVEALADLDVDDFVLDGEVVTFDGDVTSFSRLQPRMNLQDPQAARETGIDVYYYLFDLLHLDGYDLTGLALRHRKAVLQKAIAFADPLRFTPHRNEEGEAFLEEACRKGWEGVIAKRGSSLYVHSRSRDWLKFKCVNAQEFVIGGWTEPRGERIGLGALLIGYHADGELVYAGKVGTGYDHQTLRDLSRKLESRERKTPPFDRGDLPGDGVHWTTPDLVCEIGFTEWTSDGKLRHPRYKGLRHDKDPREIVRERPA